MTEWLSDVGQATRQHREARAKAYDRKAVRRRSAARLRGASEAAVNEASRWHESRAKGQRERIERVESCSIDVLVIQCQACGRKHEKPARCGCRLLCVRCRGVRARQIRVRFCFARLALLEDARARGLLKDQRRGGRFGERFITLTAPHLPDDTVSGRIERVLAAWKWFVRQLQQWQRIYTIRSLAWFRVFEWTPGTDGLGHPHLHIWVFSPFLEWDRVLGWWRDALGWAGCENVEPVIDIRLATKGVEQELVKYLTKDIDEQGDKIAPELYAEVYRALDGRRALQSSRGFMKAGEGEKPACECGARLPRRVQRKKASPCVE